MFITRLTSTHLIQKHCGIGIWVNFDALLCRIIFQVFLLHMQNLPGNLHDMIFKCDLSVQCHQGVTVLWQPNVRPFLSKQFDFECNSSRLTHFTRIELTFFLKLLFFHRFPVDLMKEQWSQKHPNNSWLIIFQSKKKIRQS